MKQNNINYHIINDKYAWLQIPKVASTLISRSLMKERRLNYEYLRMWADNKINLNRKIVYLTRNPYNRVVSNYLNKVKTNKLLNTELNNIEFDEFVEKFVQIPIEDIDIHLRPMWWFEEFVAECNDEIEWFKIEEDGLNKMCNLAGITLYNDVLNNVTPNREHFSHYYTVKTKELVEEYYKEDLVKYKYNFL